MRGRFAPALLAAMAQQQNIPAGILASGVPGQINASMRRSGPQRGQIAPAPRVSTFGSPTVGRAGPGVGPGAPLRSPGIPGGVSQFGGLSPVRRTRQDDEALRLVAQLYGL